jgi:hypothetical protein
MNTIQDQIQDALIKAVKESIDFDLLTETVVHILKTQWTIEDIFSKEEILKHHQEWLSKIIPTGETEDGNVYNEDHKEHCGYMNCVADIKQRAGL